MVNSWGDTHTHTYTRTYVRTHTNAHTRTYTLAHLCTHKHTYTHKHTCTAHEYIHNRNTHTHIYIYILTHTYTHTHRTRESCAYQLTYSKTSLIRQIMFWLQKEAKRIIWSFKPGGCSRHNYKFHVIFSVLTSNHTHTRLGREVVDTRMHAHASLHAQIPIYQHI